jgi:hypothetical protein
MTTSGMTAPVLAAAAMIAPAEQVMTEIEAWRPRFERGGRRAVREWSLADLTAVRALGNWGGLTLVHAGGDTELVVAVGSSSPTWQDAAGWLKVEAAFAAAGGRLSQWVAELPQRLTLAGHS